MSLYWLVLRMYSELLNVDVNADKSTSPPTMFWYVVGIVGEIVSFAEVFAIDLSLSEDGKPSTAIVPPINARVPPVIVAVVANDNFFSSVVWFVHLSGL